MSRVKRILFNILIGNLTPPTVPPSYIRVLAMNETGAFLLRDMKKNASLPIITKLPKENLPSELAREIEASDIYGVATGRPAGEEYRHHLTVIETKKHRFFEVK